MPALGKKGLRNYSSSNVGCRGALVGVQFDADAFDKGVFVDGSPDKTPHVHSFAHPIGRYGSDDVCVSAFGCPDGALTSFWT